MSLHIVRAAWPPVRTLRTSPLLLPLPLAAALLIAACGNDNAAHKPAPPPEVGVVTIAQQDMPFVLDLPGRLVASQVAEVRPQVSGIVLKRLFTEGALVKAGQPLYQLDPAPFEAERARAAAALQSADAQLAAAKIKADRNAELLKADAIAREVADDSTAALRQAEAAVAAARADLTAARVQLDRARIVAPISGRIEISTVSPGALVTADQATVLTTIVQLDPIHVDIVQSSTELLQLRRRLEGSEGRAGSDVTLTLEDGSVYPQPARLAFSGVTVDRGTGAVTLRATAPNAKGTLLPGMVVNARLVAGTDRNAVVAPQQGVTRSPTGDASALVVGEGNKLERRRLKLGRASGNLWIVDSGLHAGDRLVVEGLQRARADQVVTPVPAGPLAASAGAASAAARAGSGPGSSPDAASGPAVASR